MYCAIKKRPIDLNLLYRRQFFLGAKYIDYLPDWNRTEINSNYYITSHPDLAVTELNLDKTKIILLGFILDPDNPNFCNKDILNDLIKRSSTFDSILENTDKYSGRWIIIHEKNNELNIFNDACGSRSIFYHIGKDSVWCASQPHTIAKLLNIDKRDDRYFLEFINSKEFEAHERTLFGDDTLYKNILHLLPNHFLSISSKKVNRFWPNHVAEQLSVETAIKSLAPIIKGLYQAANIRFKLIQPVTAGRDSRLLLAASKDVRSNIYYFIQKFKGISFISKDIRLPKRLLKYLDLKFNIEKCTNYNSEFDRYLRKNVFMLQNEKKKLLHYNFFEKFQGYLNVSGNYTGIYRPFKWQVYAPADTPLIHKTYGRYFRKFKYVVDYIANWENDYDSDLTKFNYPIYDMFYWENKAANWVSMFVNELDIATEEWCPLNNRKILSTILSVHAKRRIEDNFQHKIVEYLWSDALKIPLARIGEDNPYRINYKKFIYNILKYIGLLNIVKRIMHRRFVA